MMSCGMQCPYCDFEDTKVIDSRLSETKDAVRRRCMSIVSWEEVYDS